ncbi:formate/nitrite transporter family protein [Halosimplex rubrum]|uniref:Formate/nitrite transporter family protein n=1 Tax=Halosimplex rubrum TaxID=869889 RepID=A0A7D5P839_9EURY|nr:formate/nitrite transporter family protein [Halosimplex rubrum]QLH79702.1 formate/nitrite transporter family protein [Halosimplex rubrum]
MADTDHESRAHREDADDVPETGEVVPGRFSSDEVFQRIVADADHEITSGFRELFFSGVAGGFAITITFLLYASLSASTESPVLAVLLYPLGFVYIIIGGYQLYTENTLPPVALTLERLASLPALVRHWLIVLAGNFAGGAVGAVVLAYGGVFEPAAAEYALGLAQNGVETPITALFFKAAFAGLIVAGVVWMDFAARDTISRIAVVYMAFLAIPLGNLFHVVVSFTEVVYTMLAGDLALTVGLFEFVLPVLLGNTLGGILLVTVVNYYQTSERRLEIEQFENVRRLSLREMLLGNLAGRSYVPLVDTLEDFVRDPESYRILVPIANPRTETALVEFACALASTREKGTVHAVHIVQAPTNRPLDDGDRARITRESERLMGDLKQQVGREDVTVETSTIVSSRSFEEVFDRARRTRPDLALMGWGQGRLWNAARAERPLDELTNRLPCDFLVVKDRGLDPSRVLLPTAGGPDSDLSAEVARALRTDAGAEVSLLHVVDGADEREAGQRFLAEWSEAHDLDGAAAIVDDSGDVEAAIESAADDHTMVLLGATERGMISRLVTDSLHLDVVNDVDASVLFAERPTDRPLAERLFGSGRREQSGEGSDR